MSPAVTAPLGAAPPAATGDAKAPAPADRGAGVAPAHQLAADDLRAQHTAEMTVRRSGGQAKEAPPSSPPALSIGTIEVTLLPPPSGPPAQPVQREPRETPQRLSRGLGRRFGRAQT